MRPSATGGHHGSGDSFDAVAPDALCHAATPTDHLHAAADCRRSFRTGHHCADADPDQADWSQHCGGGSGKLGGGRSRCGSHLTSIPRWDSFHSPAELYHTAITSGLCAKPDQPDDLRLHQRGSLSGHWDDPAHNHFSEPLGPACPSAAVTCRWWAKVKEKPVKIDDPAPHPATGHAHRHIPSLECFKQSRKRGEVRGQGF